MTTELTFLLELFLEHRLPKVTKQAVVARIKVVEEGLGPKTPLGFIPSSGIQPANPVVAQQSPSMQAIMARNPDLIPAPPQPVTVVAQTAATASALQSRQEAIAASINGKASTNANGSKRKF